MSFSLRQIQYFVAVAEHGSVSRAAHMLAVSQSTVTEAVQALQAYLGVRLVERQSRGVELTHKGHQFLRHAQRILADVADARQSLTEATAEISGTIHLGVTSLVAGYVLSDLLARFRRAHPAVSVQLVEDGQDYLEHLLVNGELDVAIMVLADRGEDRGLRTEVLEASPTRLWLPAGHRLAGLDEIHLADIAREPQIRLSTDETERTTEATWRGSGLRPTVAFRTRSVEAVRSLVATGAGVALLPDLIYRPWSLEGDRIEVRTVAEPLAQVTVGISWRRGTNVPPLTRRFIDTARAPRSTRRG